MINQGIVKKKAGYLIESQKIYSLAKKIDYNVAEYYINNLES